MMRKTIIMATLLLTLTCMSTIGKPHVVGAEQGGTDDNRDEHVKEKLVPRPQQLNTNDGSLQMTEDVNILGQKAADQDALRILNDFLKENDIHINDQFNQQSTTIALGEEGHLSPDLRDLEKSLNPSDVSELKAEGYTLEIQSETNEISQGGTIFLKGKDGHGTFYGVKTLIQLAENVDQTPTFKNLTVSDEPSMGVRGIIEGFYGNPWDQDDRLDQIHFYGDHKMNTYIYAPKDDPYHREKWREPYPQSEMERMETLIETAKDNKVDFVFAISPGIDIRFDGEKGEEDFAALIEKSESLYDMGVRNFAVLFDDINNKEGAKHAELLNRFNEEFIKTKQDVNPLITVPTDYNTHAMGVIGDLNQYTQAFSTTLDEDIMVMWTGQVVVPDSLPLENVKFMQQVYGDQIGVWWNYPVTDYLQSKLALGPIVDVDKRLEGELDFFTMNPMEHADLSKISLGTGADYSWNVSQYDADRSWNRTIELLFDDLAPEMKTFADHSSRMTGPWSIGREDAESARETMDELWEKLSKRQDATEEINLLETEFSDMIQAADTLKAELPEDILNESEKNLSKLKLLGENGQVALDMLLAKVNQEEDDYQVLKDELEGHLPALNTGARVSEDTVLAFIKEAIDFDTMPVVSFDMSKTLVAPGEEIQFTNTSSLTTETLEWTFEGANVEHSTEQNPKVSYEQEGVYTVKLVGQNPLGKDEVVKEGVITVMDVGDNETTNLALDKNVTASSVCAPTEQAKFAVDGSTRTKWCANGAGPHTLTVDLGSTSLVNEIVMKHAEAGGEPVGSNTLAYRVLVSEDGEDFKEVVKVTDNDDGVTNDQIKATKGRYVRLIVDKPTQGDDNAARIYEFEANGLEGDIELPPKYDPADELAENAAELKTIVQQMKDEEVIDSKPAHALTVHLKSISHYEDKQAVDKAVKHMKGLSRLLDHQREQELMDEEAYNKLKLHTDHMLDEWQ